MIEEITADFCKRAEVMPAAAFAKLVGWTLETEQQMRSRQEVPASIRIGRATFYRYEDVKAFLAAHRIEPVGDRISQTILQGAAKRKATAK